MSFLRLFTINRARLRAGIVVLIRVMVTSPVLR